MLAGMHSVGVANELLMPLADFLTDVADIGLGRDNKGSIEE